MPSRRHSAAMLSSPRRPSSTMRIFSSAEWCLRVARRISLITCSAAGFCDPVFFSIRRVEVKRFRAFRFVGFRRSFAGLASLRDRPFGPPSMGSEE